MFDEIDAKLGVISDLVNNAGVLYHKSRLDELSIDRLHSVFNINVIGYILCSKYAIKRMSTRYGGNGGKIVNVSSAASRLGSPNEYIDYAASKGAIDSLTRGLSLELASEKIRVNAVRPGFIYTNIHSKSGDANRVDKLKELIPLKRGGTAIEVAKAIMWLLSNDSAYCTGSFIDIAGGK
jgi:NAD(P)-dependent dehydrogenase (short-subunit alcohol dehydrogenase family)